MSRRFVAGAVLFGVLMLAVRWWVLSPLGVSSASMEPTIRTGDTVLVDRVSHRLTGWHRGDVVAFRSPQDGALTIKRIIGLPGDQVAIEDAVLSVNGRTMAEKYADTSHIGPLFVGPITVPTGDVYLLGDSRAISVDSRDYGPVSSGALVGRMMLKWSL